MLFIACMIMQYGGLDVTGMDEVTADAIRQRMSEKEWERVYEMSQDRGLYQNLITSLFPTVHGMHFPSEV